MKILGSLSTRLMFGPFCLGFIVLVSLAACVSAPQQNAPKKEEQQKDVKQKDAREKDAKERKAAEADNYFEHWEGRGTFFAGGQWQVGAGLGFIAGTPGGTQLATNFQADYFMNPRVSIGPMILLVPPGSSFSTVGGAMVVRYKLWSSDPDPDDTEGNGKYNAFNDCIGGTMSLVPFIGMGGLRSEVKANNSTTTDTSYYIPLGVALNYDRPTFGFSLTYMNNLHDINTGNGGHDRDSSMFLFTLRIRLQDRS